jgi:guanylate cyclase
MFWSGVFVFSLVWSVVIADFVDPVYEMTEPAADAAFNLVALAAVTVIVMTYFVRQRDRFQKRSDDLLHNILPDDVAKRLKSEQTMIADDFRSASVLFADVVGFTPMSASMSPSELVGLLNTVFTALDELVEKHGLEKIKTVGDEYMVASGVPRLRSDHAHAAAELALEIQARMAAAEFDGHRLSLRIGINSGPVVAGIIGTHKFSYDIWGDTVNTASRMESEGVPGRIQLSAATHALIRDRFLCEPRGTIDVKGKGQLETYFLVGRLDGPPADE